jgi:hypothetical protein
MPKRSGSKVSKLCIFCGLPNKMSEEHIWGKWLKDFVRREMNKHHFHAERIPRPGLPHISETRLKAGDPLSSKVRVVCVDCNNTWLSQIQEQAKPFLVPLIQGKATVLGRTGQEKVATWCAMATMTSEYIDSDPYSIAVSQVERSWLCANSGVPDSWRIWISRYVRHRWVGRWVHLAVPILDGKDIIAQKGAPLPNMQTTTFVIGQLYVHVMSCPSFPKLIDNWAWPFGSRLARLQAQLWPPKESLIAWPPDSITDGDADIIPLLFNRMIDAASRSMLGRRLF